MWITLLQENISILLRLLTFFYTRVVTAIVTTLPSTFFVYTVFLLLRVSLHISQIMELATRVLETDSSRNLTSLQIFHVSTFDLTI